MEIKLVERMFVTSASDSCGVRKDEGWMGEKKGSLERREKAVISLLRNVHVRVQIRDVKGSSA